LAVESNWAMRGNKFILVSILLVIVITTGAFLYFRSPRKEFLPAALAVPENGIIFYQGFKIQEQIASFLQNPLFNKITKHPQTDSLFDEYK
jgi:hypothetical protein